jgi:hypothetical protein
VAAIGADTQVEAPFELLASSGIYDRYHAPVEIYGHNLMMEKDANGGPDGERFIEKFLIEKGTVNGIDALFKNKAIAGVRQTGHKGCEHEGHRGVGMCGPPGHPYRRVGCLNYHRNDGSYDRAWE